MRWTWWASLAAHGALLAGAAAVAGRGLTGPAAEPPVSIETALAPERSLLTPRSRRELFTMEVPEPSEPMPAVAIPPEPLPTDSECSFESPVPAEIPLAPPEPLRSVVTQPVTVPTEPDYPAAAPAGADASAAEAMPRGSNPRPVYPERALRLGIEGRVVVRLHVSAAGQVVRAVVEESSGSALLDDSALGALRRWSFVPATLRGGPVAATVLVPVEFRISERISQCR